MVFIDLSWLLEICLSDVIRGKLSFWDSRGLGKGGETGLLLADGESCLWLGVSWYKLWCYVGLVYGWWLALGGGL